jgi:hypothetical protein
MAVPKDGDIVVNSSVRVLKVGGLLGIASCSITTGTMLTGEGTQSVRLVDGETNTLSGTRGFRVLGLDGPVTINLVCGLAATGLTALVHGGSMAIVAVAVCVTGPTAAPMIAMSVGSM